MRKKGLLKVVSAATALCMTMGCVSFAFSSAGAAEVQDDSSVSLSSTAAGSLVEEDGFTWDNASVYFLLTDRFRNGNTSNDHSYGRATDANGNPLSGWDTNPGTFHGGDFAGVTQSIEEGYFDDLGINALWISAPYEQTHGYCDSGKGFAHYSYHGYYVLDYTETDANFGTAEEFETLVDTAHEHGIRVIIDIVMNHAGYNTVKDMEEFNFGTLLSGASEYKYKLDGVSDVNSHIDFTSSAEDWGRWWGADWIRSGLPGYTSEEGNDYVNSLQGLPDFRTESTKSVTIPTFLKTKWTNEGTYNEKIAKYGSSNTVSGYLTSWLSNWVREYGVDGFRCDTAKHVENASWNKLKTACVQALKEWRQNNPDKPGAEWKQDFWMTGEAWDHGVSYDDYYSQGGFDSMINFGNCGAGNLGTSNIANVYQGYADYINTKEGFNALTFISSHDETLARGDEKTMIYYGSAFLMLPGGVQIFYGDETDRQLYSGVSFDGYGGSGHSLRSDMNWDSINETVLAHWQKVGTFRNNHVSVGAGSNKSLSATNGVAFSRTYDKNGVKDQIAAVIGCSANTNVTVDVSSIWENGKYIVNAYDGSSAVVTNGKVTFNSGSNCTILMEDPDGQPLVSVTGEAQFYGTEKVTVSLVDCDSAKVSVDGGNKFTVKDGDTFTIGYTGYKNDTINVKVEAENEKATTSATFSFLKLGELDDQPTTNPDDTTPTTQPVTVAQTSTLTIKSTYGTPYVYAWTGDSNALLGAWPGSKAELVSGSSDTYQVTLNVPADTAYSVVLNNGSGAQSDDITKLYNGAVIEVTSGGYQTKTVSLGTQDSSGGGGSEPYEGSVTVTIKPYDSSSSYYLYAWDDNSNALLGAWPGTKLTEKDADGNYVYTSPEGYESINVIVNMGSNAGQTDDITVKDGSIIEITNSGCTSYKLSEPQIVLSAYETLKKEAREVLAMSSYDYTASSWANVQTALTSAENYIFLGDGVTDDDTLNAEVAKLQSAKAALVLAQPNIAYAVKGNSQISVATVADADVTVTVNGKSYTGKSDDVTGMLTVSATALTASSVISVEVSRNGLSSASYSYNMSNGNITSYTPPETQPTTARPTVQPTTAQTTAQPTTVQTTTKPADVKLGDVNGDGDITIDDATLIQMYLVDLAVLSDEQLAAADTDEDGEITVIDATMIQKYLIGLISSLGGGVEPTTAETTTAPITEPATEVTEPTTTQPATEPTTTQPVEDEYVYFKNTSGWSSVSAYYWSDANTTMTTWPGQAMEKVSDNVYRISVPSDAEMIIFSNNGSSQTSDLKIAGRGYIYDNGSWSKYTASGDDQQTTTQPTTDTPSGTYTIVLTNNYKWSNVSCYYWSDADTAMTAWPGQAMTYLETNDFGQDVYTIDIPNTATHIIFNNGGSGQQTVDVDITGSAKYYISGGSGSNCSVAPWA